MKRLSTFSRWSVFALIGIAALWGSEASAAIPGKEVAQRPAKVFRSPEAPKGKFGVVAVKSLSTDGQTLPLPFFGTLDAATGSITKNFESYYLSNDNDYEVQTGCIRNGILYIPQQYYDEDGMVTNTFTVRWKRVDTESGRTLPPIVFGSSTNDFNAFLYAMTYDPFADKFYGLALDMASGAGGRLVEIDCTQEKWAPRVLGEFGGSAGDYLCNLVFNPTDRKLYGMKDNGTFCELDLNAGRAVTLRQYDDLNEDFCYLVAEASCPLSYSPYDHAYIFIFPDMDRKEFNVVSIDSDSLEPYIVGNLDPMSWLASIDCLDAYAPDDAPDQLQAVEINISGNNPEASFSFTLPETTYAGNSISSDLNLVIKIDGEELENKQLAAGKTFQLTKTLAEGEHVLTAYATLNSLQGPQFSKTFYIGNDLPQSPENLYYREGTLKWNQPSGTGIHGGFVDEEALCFNVYLNGQKLNAAPIRDLSFSFDDSQAGNSRSRIEVEAISNGKVSLKSEPLTRVLGKGLDLPFAMAPTQEQSTLFDTFNANNDDYEWFWSTTALGRPTFRVETTRYHEMPDDWLFLPPVYLSSADDLYNVTMGYCSVFNQTFDNLDICIGRDPLPESMNQVIYRHRDRNQNLPTEISVNFVVNEPGRYYIGCHSLPGDRTVFRGSILYDFNVRKAEGSGLAPADPLKVDLQTDPAGELYVIADITLPVKGLNGESLDPDSTVGVELRTDKEESRMEGHPGETVRLETAVEIDGFNNIYVTPYSSEGVGIPRFYTRYIGHDIAKAPKNVKGIVSEDNLSVTLSWDPSTEPANQGWIDPAEVQYDIYTQSALTSNRVGTSGKATEYTYTIPRGQQAVFNLVPAAVTDMGMSTGGEYFRDLLGNPYTVPMKEEWGRQVFDLQKWTYNTVAPFTNVEWTHVTQTDGLGEGVGTPTFGVVGGMQARLFAQEGWGELLCPKATTKDVAFASVAIRYWDCPVAGYMELWGRTASDQEPRKIAELTPPRSLGQWRDWEVALPAEFGNQGWIQVNVRTFLKDNQTTLLDNYRILQNLEHDFMITEIQTPYAAYVGEEVEVKTKVTNSGSEPNTATLTVELIGMEGVLAKDQVDIARIPATTVFERVSKFPLPEAYWENEVLEVRATVESTPDENPANNTASAEFLLNEDELPMVHDLMATRLDNGQDVSLTWSEPNTAHKIPEGFEGTSAFANTSKIGRWKTADLDGGSPFAIDGISWGGSEDPSSWIVYDAAEMSTLDDERLSPHSGKKMLIGRSNSYAGTEEPTRNIDFLISPEVKGNSRLSFWMNILHTDYKETVNVWISTTDDTLDPDNIEYDTAQYPNPIKCGSFKKYQSFTKSGNEGWEEISLTLPAGTKYFALVYGSYGQFAALIDDIRFEPARDTHHTIDSYDIYRTYDENGIDHLEAVALNVEGTSFRHVTGNDRAATYYVCSNVNDQGEVLSSSISNPAYVTGTGVSSIDETGIEIRAVKGAVKVFGAQGKNISVYTTDAQFLTRRPRASQEETITLQPGIYLVKAGQTLRKLVIK